jgi:hypothetical protein
VDELRDGLFGEWRNRWMDRGIDLWVNGGMGG